MVDVYVTGTFQDQSFNLYNKDNSLSGIVLSNSVGGGGVYNAFLAKYNSQGIAQWGAPMGGTSSPNDNGKGVTVDSLDNVYVTGKFRDQSFNLYNGDNSLSGLVLKNSKSGGNFNNAFLAKYDSQGIAQWGAPMGGISGTSNVGCNGVTVDTFGNVYVTGTFADQSFNLYNGDNTLSGIVLSKTAVDGYTTTFLAKYNNTGRAQWGAPMGSISNPDNYGYGVTVDINGNVYVTGSFRDQSFNLYNGNNSLSTVVLTKSAVGGSVYNVFLVKYDSDGNAKWGVPMGGLGAPNDNGKGVAVDGFGNVYVTGKFNDTSFNLYNSDNINSGIVVQKTQNSGGVYNAFLAKYNTNGIAQWGVQMGGNSFAANASYGVTAELNGNVYVAGEFADQSFNLYNSGNTLSGIVLQNSTGGGGVYNVFLAKYNTNGIAQWGVPMGGVSNPSDRGYGVTVDLNGNVYVTGQFNDTSFNVYNTGNTLSGIVVKKSQGSGGFNAFLAQYDTDGIAQWGVPMGGITIKYDTGNSVAVNRFNTSTSIPWLPIGPPLTAQTSTALLYNYIKSFL